MLLGEALNKLKNLKSKSTRNLKYLNESAAHYEDVAPAHDYQAELAERAGLVNTILSLKTAIQRTNALTMVDYKGAKISLTELILLNAQLRTDLAFLAQQMEHSLDGEARWSARSKDDVKKVFAKGFDKGFFKGEIERFERQKEELEAVLANANAVTPLVES